MIPLFLSFLSFNTQLSIRTYLLMWLEFFGLWSFNLRNRKFLIEIIINFQKFDGNLYKKKIEIKPSRRDIFKLSNLSKNNNF